MPTSSLSYDVFVTPMRPFAGAPAAAPGDDPMWSPIASTLIRGEHEAVMVDLPITVGQIDALAAWAKSFDTAITEVYVTHGHPDHWLGLSRFQQHFPGARGVALPEIVAEAAALSTPTAIAQYWELIFPGELPEPVPLEPLPGTAFELEGFELRALPVKQSDTEHSTVLHVPSIGLVVAGDVVYNGVHMMTAETDAKRRLAWIESLDDVAALLPDAVVACHKHPGAPDTADAIRASQQYLRDFSRAVEEYGTVEEIVSAMLAEHGDRDNPRTLWHSARVAVSKRG